MSVCPWKRFSAFHTDSPWRASSNLICTGGPDMAPRPPTLGRAPAQPWRASGARPDFSWLDRRPGRAQARQALVAAEQREHLEDGRRRRAAGDGQARELGEIHELEL